MPPGESGWMENVNNWDICGLSENRWAEHCQRVERAPLEVEMVTTVDLDSWLNTGGLSEYIISTG